MRTWAEFGIIYKFSNFSIENFGYFAILTFPAISDIIITEREGNTMTGIIIIGFCFGFCFLGLLACGIMLFIDTIRAKKSAKKTQEFWENFWNTP